MKAILTVKDRAQKIKKLRREIKEFENAIDKFQQARMIKIVQVTRLELEAKP